MDKKKSRVGQKARPEPAAPAAKPVRQPFDWRRHGQVAMLLWAVLLAVYANSFGSSLPYDAATILPDDPRIRAVTPPVEWLPNRLDGRRGRFRTRFLPYA